MASSAIRPLVAVAGRAVLPARLGAASFASSSRIGLDFTLPRRDRGPSKPTTTTTLEDAPRPVQTPAPAAQPTPAASSPSSATPPRAPVTKVTPTFSIPPTPTPHPASPTPSPSPALRTPQSRVSRETRTSPRGKTKLKKAPRYSPEPAFNLTPPITHTLSVLSSRNNLLLTFSDAIGPVFSTISAGSGGTFKKSQRSTYEAAHQAALKMFERILGYVGERTADEKVKIRVAFRGVFGPGREAISSAMAGPEGEEVRGFIGRVEDRTPLKVGGTRPPKPRRL